MMEMYKMTHGKYDHEIPPPFEMSSNQNQRGNKLKFKKPNWRKKNQEKLL